MNYRELINAVSLHKDVYSRYFCYQEKPYCPPFRISRGEMQEILENVCSHFTMSKDISCKANKLLGVELEVIK